MHIFIFTPRKFLSLTNSIVLNLLSGVQKCGRTRNMAGGLPAGCFVWMAHSPQFWPTCLCVHLFFCDYCGCLPPSFIEDMSKRQVGSTHASERAWRKHFVLSIQKYGGVTYEIRGKCFCEMIIWKVWVSTYTVYDLRKHKEQLLIFYPDSDVPKLVGNWETLHQAKAADVDKVLLEWIR